MVKLVETEKWAPVIGRVIIAFGEIELTTHHCIRKWAGKLIHKHMANAKLRDRFELAKELAATQDASDVTKAAFSCAIDRAKQLAEKRNLIAHNPICLVLLQDSTEAPLIEAIAHHSKDQRLSYGELLAVAIESERCASELSTTYHTFAVEKMDIDSLKSFPGLP